MPNRWIVLTLGLTGAVTLGCARGLYGPSVSTPSGPAPREIDELTVGERRDILERSEVWQPIETAKLDLLAGPSSDEAFRFDEQVTCAFHFPDEPVGGVTPKFDCELPSGDVVKVKYGDTNGEVFAEVAATRLLWALGFFVDRMYPVRVLCVQCPVDDPFKISKVEWRLGRPGRVENRLFAMAAIERDIPGKKVEVDGYEGWSWKELDGIEDNGSGATRAQIDALKLLAVFIQHVDSKPEQQAIICPKAAMGHDEEGNATCARPRLVLKDVGSSFGAASKLRYEKMRLASWASVPIWKNPATCQGHLVSSIVGTLEHPRISEAGRRFLADRLMLLSDRQLQDLFTAARVDDRHESIDGRPVMVTDWVRVFKEKREQVVNQRCAA